MICAAVSCRIRPLITAPAVLVALIAVHAVPDVARDSLMLWVGLRLRVAGRAGENGVVGGIGMTIAAELRRVVRDREPSVIEGRSSPACGRVTSSASGGEACSHVIRVRGPGVVRFVTRVTVGRCSRKLTIDVTAAAWNGYMRSRERENCFRMIEDRVGPFDRVVANRTICGEPGGNVARIGRRLEIRLVAGITVRRGARELPVDVAA